MPNFGKTGNMPVILERMAQRYPTQRRFGYELMPLYSAEVARDAYKVAKIGADHLKTEDFKRAFGAEPKRTNNNIDSWVTINPNRYTVESSVDRAELTSAPNVVQASLLMREARLKNAYEKMMLSIEKEQIGAILDHGKYGKHVLTPSGNDVWSKETSDPIEQIQEARLKVKNATGYYPNKIVISDQVWQNLRFKKNLIERLPNTSLKAGLTPEEFGKITNIAKVVIADTMYRDNNQLSFMWGNNVVLAYVPDNIYTLDTITFGITVRCPLGYADMRDYYDERSTSDVVAVDERLGWAVVNYEAGFLMKEVL
ncbi:MAG: hypothetical protein ACRCWI_02195 [Brevinema sp.]